MLLPRAVPRQSSADLVVADRPPANLLVDARRLPPRDHFSSEHTRALGSGVSGGANGCRFAKASHSELFEEGTAFLRAGDSREPTRLVDLGRLWQRFLQNQLGGADDTSGRNNARKLSEDLCSCGVQVEDPVDERDVDRAVR